MANSLGYSYMFVAGLLWYSSYCKFSVKPQKKNFFILENKEEQIPVKILDSTCCPIESSTMAEDNSNLDEKGYSQEKEDEKTEDETKGQESEFSQTNNTTTVGGVEEEEDDDDLPFPGFVRTSMFCLTQTNPFRLWCLKVITWPWFERLSMIVILLNCVTLGMYQPCDDDVCLSTRCQVLEKFDHFIFAFFALEMIIKMVAMGVYGESTYLAEAWNKLDLFIVVAGAVEYGVDTENLSLSAIRTIRVLRPLRAINRIPSMRILVMLLLDTLPMLGNVLLLCFFVFFIFGIIGVQVWAGVLRSRCFINISENISYAHFNLSPYYMPRVETNDYICSKEYTSGMRFCSNLPRYQYEGIKCNASARPFSNNTPTNDSCVNWNQYYTVCEAGDKNPFQGAISFDNIGLAWVAIFQVISLESWVNIMYYIQDAHSFWDWTYFVSLIVIGSFFMINLCLVVIATQFSETKKRETERMLQERRRFQSSSTLASNSEPGGCYAEILKYLAHLYRRGKRKLIRLYREKTGKNVKKIKPELALRKPRKKGSSQLKLQNVNQRCPRHSHHHHYHYVFLNRDSSCFDSHSLAPRASPEASEIDPVASPRRPTAPFLTVPAYSFNAYTSSESLNTLALAAAEVLTPSLFKSCISSPNHLSPHVIHSRTPSFSGDGSVKHFQFLPDVLSSHSSKNAALATTNTLVNEDFPDKFHVTNDKGMQENYLVDNMNDKFYPRLSCALSECSYQCPSRDCELGDVEGCQECETEWKTEMEETKKKKKCCQRLQQVIKCSVEHKYFQRGILLAILFNTLSMGIEYHNQPEELTRALETSNIIFSILFAVEMLMKLLAFGLFGYIKNGFNVFDGFIVILSLVELTQQGGASGLSVLRTFRLLRILKLVRFMPALRRQLVVMLRTMDNVATFFALLVLFMFIFSVLGMNVFGGKFCWKEDGSHCTCKEALDIANDCECDRANFNTLLWALVTVFQVLTQEDWNTVLYNGMEKTSPWAALYFVALMTFGNYVLFNLLVAILVEGFSSEEEEKKRIKENKNKINEEEQMEANNNNEQIKDSLKQLDVEAGDMKINNKEKEKMLGLTPAAKEKTVVVCTVPPPIITHTEATPMATPQGSPHEHGVKEPNKSCLAIRQSAEMNTLTVEIPIMNTPRASPRLSRASSLRSSSRSSSRSVSFKGSTRLSARVSPRPSPRPSPRLWRSFSYGSRSRNSWKFKRAKDGDKTQLVYNNDTDRDDCIDIDDDENDDDEVFHSNSCLSQKSHDKHQFKSRECNGDIPLNNQRIVRSQNCLLQRRSSSPRNPIRSRNNSSSSAHSVCNSIYLRRQNTFPVRHKCKSLSSTGIHSDDYKQNNLSDSGERRDSNVPPEEDKKEAEEEDPDAMDEANCSWSWCPEPKGCFKTRNEYSLYIFSPENMLRKFSHHVMTQRWFDNTVLFFIALNCITLAMERPDIPPDSPEREFLTYSNYVFTVIFMLEMTIKVLSKGLLIGKHAYLKSGWNIMDGALVVISLVDILISLQAQSSPRIFGILRVFRLLRTLRPLRVISRAPGLKLVVQTLLSSLRPIGNIVLICCTFFIIFGILGVQLFKGTFYHCKGPNIRHVSNKTQCLADRRNVWINEKYNFDDLGQALMALFVLASKDGWVSIMYTGLDAVGVDQQPIVNYSELRLIYFISFLLLVGFFVLNMFVGVVVENFHKCREDQEKEEKARRMAKRVRKLDQKRQKLKQTPYWADYSRSRLLIYTVINSKYFDLAIAGVIGLNVITMAMEYYMMPEELKFALKIFNYFFTSVFILEAALKVVSLGWFRYFRDRWNQLDMLIVVLSIVGIVLEEMETNVIPINPTIIRVMRVLRIARVLKLLKMAKGIRALLDTVIQALPQVGNLGLLFFLLFFIFAALGVELFGRLECSEEHPCDGLSDHAHFKNFGMAFLTLFRVATGDNWNGILKDTLRTDCDSSDNCLNNCCVNPIIAPVYFVVFVLMAQFVLVNVVVAVLMKHLEETYKYKEMDDEMEDELKQEIEDIEKCQKATEAIEMARMQEMQRMELDEGETDVLLNNTDSDVQIEITSNDGLSQNAPRNTFPLMPPSLTLRPPSSEPIETDNIPPWEDNQDKYDYNLLNPSSIKLGIMNSSERDTFSTRVNSTLGEVTYHLDIPQITVPELTSIRNRRPTLVRQYSQEVSTGSPEQKHNLSPQRKSHSFEETDHEVKSTLHAHSHPLLGKSVNSGVKLQSGIHFESDPDQTIKDTTRCKSRNCHIFRSASSGTDHSRLKERYQKFPKQHSQNDVSHSNTTINIIKTSISSLKETIGSQCTLSSEQLADDQYTLIDWEEDELFCDEEVKRITGEANEEVDLDEQYPERELNCDISKDSNFYKRSTCCDNSGFGSFTQDENRLNHRGPELSPGIQHYAAFDNRKENLTLNRKHLSKSDSLTIPGDKSENITLGGDVCKCSSLDDSIQSQAKPQQKDVSELSHVVTSDILTEKQHVFHTRSHIT